MHPISDEDMYKKLTFRETLIIQHLDEETEITEPVGGLCLDIQQASGRPPPRRECSDIDTHLARIMKTKDSDVVRGEEINLMETVPKDKDDPELEDSLETQDERNTGKFLVHFSSQFDFDGNNAGSTITTWIDRNMHTLEEMRKEFYTIKAVEEENVTEGVNLETSGILTKESAEISGILSKDKSGKLNKEKSEEINAEACKRQSRMSAGQDGMMSGGDNTEQSKTASEGQDRRPSEGGSRRPSEGGSRRPSEGGSRRPSEGGSRRPSEGGSRRPSEGGSRRPSGGGSRRPSEGGSRRPSEGGSRRASTSGSRRPSEGERERKLSEALNRRSIIAQKRTSGVAQSRRSSGAQNKITNEPQNRRMSEGIEKLHRERSARLSRQISQRICKGVNQLAKDKELSQEKVTLIQKTLYVGLLKKFYYVKHLSPTDEVDDRKFVSLRKAKDFVSEGANFLLMRYLAITIYIGTFELSAMYINGDLCRNIYYCTGPEGDLVNDKKVDTCTIHRTIIEECGIEHHCTTVLTLQGQIVNQTWEGIPYILQINPLLDVTNEDPVSNEQVLLKHAWESDMQLMSKYLDEKVATEIKIKSYMIDHPEFRNMISDYIHAILLLKPEDIIDFTMTHFLNFAPQFLPQNDYY